MGERIRSGIKKRFLSGFIKHTRFALLLVGAVAHAQSVQSPDAEELRRRAQAAAQERQRQSQAPKVDLQGGAPVESSDSVALPKESPCFVIHEFVLDAPVGLLLATRIAGASDLPLDPFRFVRDGLHRYANTCIGKQGLALIVKRLSNQILSKGYSTTRLGIPEQHLGSGIFTLVLVPGVIRAIRFSDSDLYSTYKNAFPTGPGQLLNLRDLEQGLEQMKRVPSQEVNMKIVPGETPGESDVVIDVKRSKFWKVTGTLDDSGTKANGKLQAGVNLAVDGPLGLNDLFNIGVNTDAERQGGQRGTSGDNVYYAIPFGYWNFALSGNSYDYHEEVAGANQTFVYSGKSRNLEARISQLFQRDQSQKNTWQFSVGKRWSHAYIDATDIALQKRDTTFAQLAWIHTHYFGNAQLDLTVANRWGVGWANGQTYLNDVTGQQDPGTNNQHFTLQTIDATLNVPFKVADQHMTYVGTLRAQATRFPLYVADQFAIGGRYTVRGFDGESTLTAERGFYVRNEFDLPIANSGQSAYLGLDVGKVYGPSVVNLVGDKLAGATVGVRGGLFGLTYDMFSSWALYKPQGFNTAMPAVGFSLAYQY